MAPGRSSVQRPSTLHPHLLVQPFLVTGTERQTERAKVSPWEPTALPHKEQTCVKWESILVTAQIHSKMFFSLISYNICLSLTRAVAPYLHLTQALWVWTVRQESAIWAINIHASHSSSVWCDRRVCAASAVRYAYVCLHQWIKKNAYMEILFISSAFAGLSWSRRAHLLWRRTAWICFFSYVFHQRQPGTGLPALVQHCRGSYGQDLPHQLLAIPVAPPAANHSESTEHSTQGTGLQTHFSTVIDGVPLGVMSCLQCWKYNILLCLLPCRCLTVSSVCVLRGVCAWTVPSLRQCSRTSAVETQPARSHL